MRRGELYAFGETDVIVKCNFMNSHCVEAMDWSFGGSEYAKQSLLLAA